MTCPQCGREATRRFCGHCGAALQPQLSLPIVGRRSRKHVLYGAVVTAVVLLAVIVGGGAAIGNRQPTNGLASGPGQPSPTSHATPTPSPKSSPKSSAPLSNLMLPDILRPASAGGRAWCAETLTTMIADAHGGMLPLPRHTRFPTAWDQGLGDAIAANTGALASAFRDSDGGASVAKVACDAQWFPLPTHSQIAASKAGDVDAWLVSTSASEQCGKDLTNLAQAVLDKRTSLADVQRGLPDDAEARQGFADIVNFAKDNNGSGIGEGVYGLMSLCNRVWPAPGGRGPERLDAGAARKVLSSAGVTLVSTDQIATFCHGGTGLDGARSLIGTGTTTAGQRVDVELIVAAPKGGEAALASLDGNSCNQGWLDNGHMVRGYTGVFAVTGWEEPIAFGTETFSGKVVDPNEQGRVDEYIGGRLGDIVLRLHLRPDALNDGPDNQANKAFQDYSSSVLDAIQTEAF
jgi:hypothetical protein